MVMAWFISADGMVWTSLNFVVVTNRRYFRNPCGKTSGCGLCTRLALRLLKKQIVLCGLVFQTKRKV